MKVLFFTFHLPLDHEPGAFRPWMEAQLMRDLGCQVTVITSAIQYMTGEDLRGGRRGWCTEEQQEGIRILRVWGLRNYRRNLWRRLLHYMIYAGLACVAGISRAGKAERVFVGTDPIFITPTARIVARMKGARLVLDERDLYPETALAIGVLKPGLVAKLMSVWQRSMRKRARHILAATPGIRSRLLELEVPAERVRVLCNADVYLHSGECEQDSVHQLLGQHAPKEAKFIVVYAGSMGLSNDVKTLLDAAELLCNERDIGFVLAGEGEHRAEYEQRIRDSNLNAVMTGPLPRHEARQIILGACACACAHMYVAQPSFANDALPSKILDYMALGKAVVFCGEGDTANVLTAAGSGICCPPGDARGMAGALRWLRDHPDECNRMGKAAQRWFSENVGRPVASAVMEWALELEQHA